MYRKLYDYLLDFYTPEEFPAIVEQINQWHNTRPFESLKIIDATPCFRNTMVKYCALLAGGAELYVPLTAKLPSDPEIQAMLPDFGIKCIDEKALAANAFDLAADCAGTLCDVNSKYGYVELTRSGLYYYQQCKQPVYSADSGLLKKFETILGTGDGFARAMAKSGMTDFAGADVLLFGGGKVGFGIAWHLLKKAADVTIADFHLPYLPDGAKYLNASDHNAVLDAIAGAKYIITATGVKDALAPLADALTKSNAILVNMGAEDEFGQAMPGSRVLNDKKPLNFILDEPTLMKFIAPTMAVDNFGLEALVNRTLPCGISYPSAETESRILQSAIAAKVIPQEDIDLILKYHQYKEN